MASVVVEKTNCSYTKRYQVNIYLIAIAIAIAIGVSPVFYLFLLLCLCSLLRAEKFSLLKFYLFTWGLLFANYFFGLLLAVSSHRRNLAVVNGGGI